MIINKQYRCIFVRIFRDRSVVKFGMTRDFDSRIVGSSPTAPLKTGSKSMVDGWFWEPAARGSNPLSPITYPGRPINGAGSVKVSTSHCQCGGGVRVPPVPYILY
jgi:hypothetical protein